MISHYYHNDYIDAVYKIESETFDYPWLESHFLQYSMDFNNSISCIYKIKNEVVGYLMAESILDEIHITIL